MLLSGVQSEKPPWIEEEVQLKLGAKPRFRTWIRVSTGLVLWWAAFKYSSYGQSLFKDMKTHMRIFEKWQRGDHEKQRICGYPECLDPGIDKLD